MKIMWFPFTWLSLGFLLKWWRENKARWGTEMFWFTYLFMSFGLIVLLFGQYHVAWYQALFAFVFWGFVGVLYKIEP